jgi:hypothetical protein
MLIVALLFAVPSIYFLCFLLVSPSWEVFGCFALFAPMAAWPAIAYVQGIEIQDGRHVGGGVLYPRIRLRRGELVLEVTSATKKGTPKHRFGVMYLTTERLLYGGFVFWPIRPTIELSLGEIFEMRDGKGELTVQLRNGRSLPFRHFANGQFIAALAEVGIGSGNHAREP